ncbi:MAG: hypothetical protein HC817_06065 [Saprospiraceae bacterium]|nr:hypothetical protein [Saprospiraceae bacterium]
MKKQFAILSLFISIIIFNAFQTPKQPLEQIHAVHLNDMGVFEKSIKKLKTTAATTPLSIDDLQTAFKEARLAYKKIGWLIGYLEPENEKNFNGPPLTRIDPTGYNEIDPAGFQPIEEIIFGEEIENEMPKLNRLVNELAFFAAQWTEQMAQHILSDREIFEAFRTELTQLFAMSFTGFDSPVAFHALPEALVAWTTIEQNFNFYIKNLERKIRF